LDDGVVDDLGGVGTAELLRRYAAILEELRLRGVVRTRNAPLGDFAEYLVVQVYGGELAANSVKSYDLVDGEGRRIQVKARTVGPGTRGGAVFSAFRSFDFEAAVLLVFDERSYDLLWAREVSPGMIEAAGRYSAHVNGHCVRIVTAEALGVDVSDRFRALTGLG